MERDKRLLEKASGCARSLESILAIRVNDRALPPSSRRRRDRASERSFPRCGIGASEIPRMRGTDYHD
jgi:hypothetical protein